MKQPDLNGDLAAKTLYSFDDDKSNIVSQPHYCNLFGPPSLTPGVEYPLSDKEERIREAGYNHGSNDAMRMNRAGHLVEDDPVLNMYREIVEEIRKEKIKSGEIEPINKKERKWRLGL